MANVPLDRLTLTSGEDSLSLCGWTTRGAQHGFCRHGGIYPFHRKRPDPGSVTDIRAT